MHYSDLYSQLLLNAATEGDFAEALHLAELGADVNIADDHGRTPLMFAALAGDLSAVRLFLARGANVNAADDDQVDLEDAGTVLRRAVSQGHLEVAGVLLEHGADPNGRSDHRAVPLSWAAMNNNLEMARLLLARGADPNLQDEHSAGKDTPLSTAAFYGHLEMVDLLLRYGAHAAPTELIFVGQGRMTSSGDHINILRLLLSHGAIINAADEPEGWTALQVAAWSMSGPRIEVVKFLLDEGADVNARSKEGRTALMDAVKAGHEAIVRLLLGRGADPNFSDDQGRTALSVAADEGYLEICHILNAYGAGGDEGRLKNEHQHPT